MKSKEQLELISLLAEICNDSIGIVSPIAHKFSLETKETPIKIRDRILSLESIEYAEGFVDSTLLILHMISVLVERIGRSKFFHAEVDRLQKQKQKEFEEFIKKENSTTH